MGGYRSSPELTKLSIAESKINTTYAIKEMCGKLSTIKDGESTYRMLLSSKISYLETRDVPCLVFLMVMEVYKMINRS